MRCIVKVAFPVEKANELVRNGTLGKTIQAILEEQKPEAAYFYAPNGQRGGILIVNLEDPSQLPALAEPWFLALNASIEVQPTMTPADLGKAGPSIAQLAKRYG